MVCAPAPRLQAVGALLCVNISLAFCAALEHSHGLAMRVPFLEELWPQVEGELSQGGGLLADRGPSPNLWFGGGRPSATEHKPYMGRHVHRH